MQRGSYGGITLSGNAGAEKILCSAFVATAHSDKRGCGGIDRPLLVVAGKRPRGQRLGNAGRHDLCGFARLFRQPCGNRGAGRGSSGDASAGGAHGRRRLCPAVASKRTGGGQTAAAGTCRKPRPGSSRLRKRKKTLSYGLAQARNEEEAKRIQREDRVTEHVRAQLAVRSLDSQGGERAVGKSRYATARRAEGEARARMQSAKDEFEQVSRMRAALDQELGRVRDEMLRARQLASRNRYAPSAVSRPSSGPCLWRWTTPCMRR